MTGMDEITDSKQFGCHVAVQTRKGLWNHHLKRG